MGPKTWCVPSAESGFKDIRFGKVSKKSLRVLLSLYERPIIFVTPSSPLMPKITFLKLFLVLKKKLSVIFDILCKPSYLVKALSRATLHWLLPGNILSLADLHALCVSQGDPLEPYNRRGDFFSDEEMQDLEASLFGRERDDYPCSLTEDTMEKLDRFNHSKSGSNSIIKVARILVRLFKVHLFKCQVALMEAVQGQLQNLPGLPEAEHCAL